MLSTDKTMSTKYKIAVIDDDSDDIDGITERLGSVQEFVVVKIQVKSKDTIDNLIEKIILEQIDAALIDHRLNKLKKNVGFKGATLFNELQQQVPMCVPLILTNKKDDALKIANDSFHVCDKEDFEDEDKDVFENVRNGIITMCINNRKRVDELEKHLQSLISKKNRRADEDMRLKEIKNELEKLYVGKAKKLATLKDVPDFENLHKFLQKAKTLLQEYEHTSLQKESPGKKNQSSQKSRSKKKSTA